MPRPKKDGVKVNFYLERKIVEDLDKYCEETGMLKTVVMERLLRKFLDEYFSKPKDERTVL